MSFKTTQQLISEFINSRPELEAHILDLDLNLAIQAHCGVSQFPERGAAFDIAGYAEHLVSIRHDVHAAIERAKGNGLDVGDDDEIERDLTREIDSFKPALQAAYNTYFHSKARCMSTHVTGPANFPVSSQRKKHDAADNRYQDIVSLIEKATKRMIRSFLPNGDGSTIRSDADNALEQLENKLAVLKTAHEKMKAANKIIRRFGKGEKFDQQSCIDALITEGFFKPDHAKKLVQPDYAGRVGYPAYSLTNSNAEMKRITQRIKEQKILNERREEPSGLEQTLDNGIQIELSDDSKIVVIFDGKPSDDTRSLLKRHAFKWSRFRGAWVRKHTLNAEKAFRCSVLPTLQTLEAS